MDQGGKIRTGNILRGLKGGAFDLTLASPAPRDGHPFAGDLESACDRFISWPERAPSRCQRVVSLASGLPVAVASARSAIWRARLGQALAENPDVAVVDFPHAGVLV